MKILFISPNIIGISDGINRIQPPLGIGYLAAAARDAGHNVFIRDTALEGYHIRRDIGNGLICIGESDTDIKNYIKSLNPDMICVSCTLSNLETSALNIINLAKQTIPGIITVLGGNHITFSDTDYDTDHIIKGEGELSLIKLLHDIDKGDKPPKHITGEKIKNLDLLSFPARDLMNMQKYFDIGMFHSSRSNRRVLSIMTSRGCPQRCSYCTSPIMWGRTMRYRTPKNVFLEIKQCMKLYGIEEVQFEDDTLTIDVNRLLELCRLIKPLKIKWCVPNGIRINYHVKRHDLMFRSMKESGCYQVTFACESGSQRVLSDILKKDLELSHVKPAISKAKASGMLVHVFWMVGAPGEKKFEMDDTIKFALDCGADSHSVSIMSALPGCEIYDIVNQQNLWWNKDDKNKVIYRKSLYKVDGFTSAEEFEFWVCMQNSILNANDKIKIKQT